MHAHSAIADLYIDRWTHAYTELIGVVHVLTCNFPHTNMCIHPGTNTFTETYTQCYQMFTDTCITQAQKCATGNSPLARLSRWKPWDPFDFCRPVVSGHAMLYIELSSEKVPTKSLLL